MRNAGDTAGPAAVNAGCWIRFRGRGKMRFRGRKDDLGSLEVGKKADLTIIDLNNASLRPVINLVSNIVHYGNPGIVSSVMVDGRFLMREGEVLTMDEESVIAEAQEATVASWHRLGETSSDIELPPSLINHDIR